MAVNETLASCVREIIAARERRIEEKRMFGGLCFMVNDKMCVGVEASRLMVRFDPAMTDEVMEKEGVTPMDFTKKVMKGYAFVDIAVLKSKEGVEYWVNMALDYNKLAKANPKPLKGLK
jgi:TfoX/Sxy family transcriptional regulator of competence genes